jgi:hypothetical protein
MINTVEKIYSLLDNTFQNFKVTKQDGTISCGFLIEEANTDYQAIQEWIAEGNTVVIDNGGGELMASILKVDTIQDQSGNNIINESADTITIGASGDTITIPSGATFDASSATVTIPAVNLTTSVLLEHYQVLMVELRYYQVVASIELQRLTSGQQLLIILQ